MFNIVNNSLPQTICILYVSMTEKKDLKQIKIEK